MSVIQAFRRTSVSAQLAGSDSIEHQLAALHALQLEHPFWNCRLLTAFARGALSRIRRSSRHLRQAGRNMLDVRSSACARDAVSR